MTLNDLINFIINEPEISALEQFEPILYFALSYRGHCFDMAYTSSLLYTNPIYKPRPTDVMNLDKVEIEHMIKRYHLVQLLYVSNQFSSPSERLGKLKTLIDAGVPPVICYDKHAVTGIGYVEIDDTFYLIAYDNHFGSDWNIIYKIDFSRGMLSSFSDSEGKIVENWNDAFAIEPKVILPQEQVKQLLEWLRKYLLNKIAVTIHSPVNVRIQSADSKIIEVVNDQITRNDFSNALIDISASAKLFLLPLGSTYSFELVGRDSGNVSISIATPTQNSISLIGFKGIGIHSNSRIIFNATSEARTDTLNLDLNGDGSIDSTAAPIDNYFLGEEGIRAQYYLTVTSNYGTVTGLGWYDSGYIANFSVSSTSIPAGFLTYYIFTKWSGDYTGNEYMASIIMNSPKTITAEWITDYSQLYLAIGGVGGLIVIILISIFLIRRKKSLKRTRKFNLNLNSLLVQEICRRSPRKTYRIIARDKPENLDCLCFLRFLT